MSKLASRPETVFSAIRTLNENLGKSSHLADRLGQAHAYYVLEEENGKPLFGFSKFVGYEGLTPEYYLKNYKSLDGRNTEHALSKWFEEVRHGSPTYNDLYSDLIDWMAQYGKRPRAGETQKVRLMVLRSEFRQSTAPKAEDRKLLELLISVADMLPASQRHELRAAL